MTELVSVDEDVAEDPNGTFVLGVGLENLGGLLDFLVVAWEGLLNVVDNLLGCHTIVVDTWIHNVEILTQRL